GREHGGCAGRGDARRQPPRRARRRPADLADRGGGRAALPRRGDHPRRDGRGLRRPRLRPPDPAALPPIPAAADGFGVRPAHADPRRPDGHGTAGAEAARLHRPAGHPALRPAAPVGRLLQVAAARGAVREASAGLLHLADRGPAVRLAHGLRRHHADPARAGHQRAARLRQHRHGAGLGGARQPGRRFRHGADPRWLRVRHGDPGRARLDGREGPGLDVL
ncbi:MAG: Exopolysaccharide synthesis, ExoD, partial [uncultured Acetobacteraceae bacterium]